MSRVASPFFLLGIAYVGLFVSGMTDNARGPILPDMILSLGLRDSEASLFFSISALASMPGTLFMGNLLRRMSAVRCLQLAIGVFVLGFWCIASSTNFAVILIGAALYGM